MAINKPKIQIQVDIPNSINQINADLSQLEKQLKPINISLNINNDIINKQTSQIQAQIQNISKSNTAGFKIPISFKIDENKIKKIETDIGVIESKFSNINLGNMSGFSEQVSNANKNVSQLKTNLDRYNQAKIGQDKVDAFNKLDNSVKQTKKQVDDLFKSQKALQNLAGTHGRFQAFLNDNVKVAQKFPDEVNRIKASLKSLNSETDMTKLTTGLQNVKGQISSLRATAKKDGLLGRTFLGELGNDIKKMFTWTVGGGAIFGTINTFKKMIDTARDLDKVATNVQIASGKSNAEIQKLMSTYSQMGETLGATTVEIGKSADEFLRQGKSVAETNQLIKDSMMLSKLGEVDSAEATRYLTSAMKGYNISVKDSIGIVDKLTKVDQISATSAGGLAEGMSKTASMASLAGVSIDKLIGYLAVVGETTQKSMDQVGTSFQAMFSRMGNVKAGKFVDDITGESLNDVESVLKKIGISLRDSSGQFRNFGTVLDEIGDKWKSYDSVEKNAIATAIAGTRQRENFTVLMEQYGTALKYQESSANSAGTATQKMSVYTDSLEAKTKAATAAFEKLSKAVVNGDIFKGIIDAGGTLSKVLSSIVESGHGLPAIITSISAIRSMMGKDAGKEYAHLLRVA